MAIYAGTWIQADEGKYLRLDVRSASNEPWGTVMGTGWTCKLEVRAPGATALTATLTGSWEDATETAALFAITATSTFDPAAGEDRKTWEAILRLESGGTVVRMGADDDRQPFSLTVLRWP